MIDAHIHVDLRNPLWTRRLGEGVGADPERLAAALQGEMTEAGVTDVFAMGRGGGDADDPLGVRGTRVIARLIPSVHLIGVMDYQLTTPSHLKAVEDELSRGEIKALKAYVGYSPAGPDHPGYRLSMRQKLFTRMTTSGRTFLAGFSPMTPFSRIRNALDY